MKKNFLYVFLALFLINGIVSCKSEEEKAEETVDDFFEAIEDNDTETAKELSTDESHEFIDLVEEERIKYEKDNTEKAKIDIRVIGREMNGDKGKIKVKIKIGDKEKENKIDVVKKKDKWLVIIKPRQVTILRSIVFFGRYQIIIKKYTKIKFRINKKNSKKRKKS